MSVSIVADESVDFSIVKELRKDGFEVFAVVHECPGVMDKDVLEIAVQRRAVLLTEDSDFGEWIFSHGQKGTTVLYIRYKHGQLTEITRAVKMVLRNYDSGSRDTFIVITPRKIRTRDVL